MRMPYVPLRKAAGILLIAGLVTSVVTPSAQRESIYAVQQVLLGLTRDPSAWIGRAVLVRGTAMQPPIGCAPSQWCSVALFKAQRPRIGPALLLEPGPSDPLVAQLRHVPLVDQIMPGPQRVHLSTPAVYRLLFQAVPGISCGPSPCVNALLVDPAI
jgi:hypothetical protein